MTHDLDAARRGFAALLALSARAAHLPTCELCRAPLRGEHGHVFRAGARMPLCVCSSCGFVHAAGHRPASRRVLRPRLALDEAAWRALEVPVALAFFHRAGPAAPVQASYPSPAGLVESVPPAQAWDALRARCPELDVIEPAVEALLVWREGELALVVPLDECYRLAGELRAAWRGLSGGEAAREIIERRLGELAARAEAA